MAISPIVVGSTHRPLAITWLRDDGSAVDLTGATVTMRFAADSGTPAAFTGAGTVSVTNAAGGQFTYALAAGDIATAGNYHVQFIATYGTVAEKSDPIPFYVLAAL